MAIFERPLIAIDIGSSAVKMVELSGSGKRRRLKKYGVEAIPNGAVEDGMIVDATAVQTSIESLSKRLGFKGRRSAVSLSGSSVMVRKVTVAVGKDVVLEEQIPFHAEQAFQIDPSGLYYDFVTLPAKTSRADQADILLVGARRENVEQYVACIRSSGIKLGVIECDAVSLNNAFEQNYGIVDGLIAIISIGASHVQVSFLSDGTFLFSRDIPLGGNTYNRRLMEALNLPFETAEALKTGSSGDARGLSVEAKRIVDEVNLEIVNEISETIRYFTNSGDGGDNPVLKFGFLTGGASRTAGLDSAIAAALHIPVGPLNPFQRIEINERKFQLDLMANVSPMLAVAAGLGLRAFKDKE